MLAEGIRGVLGIILGRLGSLLPSSNCPGASETANVTSDWPACFSTLACSCHLTTTHDFWHLGKGCGLAWLGFDLGTAQLHRGEVCDSHC